MIEVMLFTLVPAIVVGTVLYAMVSEMRDSRSRASRREQRALRSQMALRPSSRPWRARTL
jgi:hypothetical protein